jgi:hypothetical protein
MARHHHGCFDLFFHLFFLKILLVVVDFVCFFRLVYEF